MARRTFQVPPVDGVEELVDALNREFAELTLILSRIEGFSGMTPEFYNDVDMKGKRIRGGGIPNRRDDFQLRGLTLSATGFEGAFDAQNRSIINVPPATIATQAPNFGQIEEAVEEVLATSLPAGIILLWSGSIVSIPPGWAICDGTGGTPDLRDRFIVGSGTTYNPGNTGGADTQDFSHTHASGTLATDTNAVGPSATTTVDNDLALSTVTVASNAHTHSHSHSVTTGVTGSSLGSAVDNKPLYYSLAFIMKL
jgi:hypothetical protein